MNMPILAQTSNNSNQVTMTSPEIVDFINAHRQAVATIEKPYVELHHRSFMSKVPQVLGVKDAAKFIASSFYQGNGSAKLERQIYVFPKREACLMAMSYSYELQAQIFDRMTAMENHIAAQNLPSYAIEDPIERAKKWIEEEKQKQLAIQERDHAIATKAEIGSRREATAMGRLSAKVKEVESLKVQLDKSLDFASIKSVEIATGRKFGWHALKKWSKSNSSEIKTIPDPNFGEVKTYHKDAWLAVYNINLSSIRGGAA